MGRLFLIILCLHYARAALHDFERIGPGAARDAADARDLITRLEQDTG